MNATIDACPNSSGLMLHRRAKPVTLDEFSAIPTPALDPHFPTTTGWRK